MKSNLEWSLYSSFSSTRSSCCRSTWSNGTSDSKTKR